MASSCSGCSFTPDNSAMARGLCFDCTAVVPDEAFNPDCVSKSGSGDALRPSSGGFGSFATGAGSGTDTGGA
jgi:hypothetical protein